MGRNVKQQASWKQASDEIHLYVVLATNLLYSAEPKDLVYEKYIVVVDSRKHAVTRIIIFTK